MSPDSNWKRLERKTAEKLNGQRTGNRGKSTVDVLHDVYGIECKYRKKLPDWLKGVLKQAEQNAPDKTPLGVLKEKYSRDELVLMRMSDFIKLIGADRQA